jgi:hypothetical protein
MNTKQLSKHPNCTYLGMHSKGQYFEFYNKEKEQLLTIRFDDMPWQYGITDGPSFINAELNCTKTGEMISYTTNISKAKQLLKSVC